MGRTKKVHCRMLWPSLVPLGKFEIKEKRVVRTDKVQCGISGPCLGLLGHYYQEAEEKQD